MDEVSTQELYVTLIILYVYVCASMGWRGVGVVRKDSS